MTTTPDPGPTDVGSAALEAPEPAGGAPSGNPGPGSVGPVHHPGTPRAEDAGEEDLEEYGGES